MKGGQVVCMLVCATSKKDGACALRHWLKTGAYCVFVCANAFFCFFVVKTAVGPLESL